MVIVVLAGAALAGLAVLAAFVRAERRGRPEVALGALLGVVLVEALLYQSEHLVPTGLFRPSVLGQSIRLPEMVIGAALAARFVVQGPPRRTGAAGSAWTLFLVWYATQAVLGVLLGNPTADIIFQARVLVYIGGGYALVSAIPAEHLVSARFLGRMAVVAGAVVAVLIPLSLSETSFDTGLPGVPLPRLGHIGADSASIFVVAGMVALLVELGRRRQRPLVLLATLPLLAAPFATNQRAAVVGLVATLAVLAAVSLTGTWSRRALVSWTEVGIAAACLGALAIVSLVATADPAEPTPIEDFYNETFEATGKQQSASTRILLWDEAYELWQESPVIGSGLGKQFEIKRAATQADWVAGGFHNLGYDLLVRSGVVGLVLFAVALGLTVREGMRAWLHHLDRRIAALALAAVACAGGLLAKGMVESVLEKAKLSVLLGVLLGVMVSAGRSALRQAQTGEVLAADGDVELTLR